MSNSQPGKWRYIGIFAVLVIVAGALVVQHAVMLHDAQNDAHKLVRRQEHVLDILPARQGVVSMRTRERPVVAATSKQVPFCFVDPSIVDNEQLSETAIKVGEALNMDPVRIQEQVAARRDTTWRWLKKGMTHKELEQIEALNLPKKIPAEQLPDVAVKLARILKIKDVKVLEQELAEGREVQFCRIRKYADDGKTEMDLTQQEVDAINHLVKKKGLAGVGIRYEQRRFYPNNELAAPVLGFLLRHGEPGEGIESILHSQTSCKEGILASRADSGRRRIAPLPEETVLPRDGNHVFLTIDTVIQSALEQAVAGAVEKFRANWGVGIVMDCNTGEVLGMVSYPTFNPNQFNKVASPELRKNRCLVEPYEPGSAFKPLIAAAAVDANMGVTWSTRFNCKGGVYNAPNGGTISDHGSSYGSLSLEEIITVSSNIGMALVGEKLGNKRIHEAVDRFGFGHYTQIQLPDGKRWPGESAGIVTPLRYMDGYSLRRVPFGQQVSVTALQLANAYCAVANGGELLQPRLVDCITDPSGRRVLWRGHRQVIRRVLSRQTSRTAVDAMATVVDKPNGTGRITKMERWTSFGKTGTAQIAKDGIYVPGAFTASFVAGAPASKPQLVCLVSVYWPHTTEHYGSQVAAPAVKEVLEKSLSYLEVPPDRQDEEGTAPVSAGPVGHD